MGLVSPHFFRVQLESDYLCTCRMPQRTAGSRRFCLRNKVARMCNGSVLKRDENWQLLRLSACTFVLVVEMSHPRGLHVLAHASKACVSNACIRIQLCSAHGQGPEKLQPKRRRLVVPAQPLRLCPLYFPIRKTCYTVAVQPSIFLFLHFTNNESTNPALSTGKIPG